MQLSGSCLVYTCQIAFCAFYDTLQISLFIATLQECLYSTVQLGEALLAGADSVFGSAMRQVFFGLCGNYRASCS